MLVWSTSERIAWGTLWCATLGVFVGAIEFAGLTMGLRLPMAMGWHLLLGIVAVLQMGVLAGCVGLLGGVIVHVPLRALRASWTLAIQLGIVGLFLCGFYFWQMAEDVAGQGRQGAAIFLGSFPLFIGIAVFYNSAFWLRRIERGMKVRLRWVPLFAGAAAVTVLGAVVSYPTRYTGGQHALADDANVLLVTVDTLRRDYVAAYGDPAAGPTPNMDRLAAKGVIFTDAVTPMPETAPAHASIMTGLGPLGHGVLSNGHRARRGEPLAKVLRREGYATAAFVSSFALDARVGLNEGFYVYDDDLGSPVPGWSRLRLPHVALRAWMRWGSPESTPQFLERDGASTNARFLSWLDDHEQVPFFAWVHYFEPHAPYEPHGMKGFESNGTPEAPLVAHRERMDDVEWSEQDVRVLRRTYQEEVARVDALLGELLDELDARDLAADTTVIIVGDHGEMLGEHNEFFHHQGLWDEAVRVPMIAYFPGRTTPVTTVEPQVRVMDLYATVLAHLDIEPESESEAISLLGFIDGRLTKPLWTPLVGRRDRDLAAGALVGLRNNGIKYIRDLSTGGEMVFDVGEDPAEEHPINTDQPKVVEQARRLIGRDAVLLAQLLEVEPGEAGAGTAAMLEALGYGR
jgi:arylsulfatase A-like enzyme